MKLTKRLKLLEGKHAKLTGERDALQQRCEELEQCKVGLAIMLAKDTCDLVKTVDKNGGSGDKEVPADAKKRDLSSAWAQVAAAYAS